MSAFAVAIGGKADMGLCLHMSASDPKRTSLSVLGRRLALSVSARNRLQLRSEVDKLSSCLPEVGKSGGLTCKRLRTGLGNLVSGNTRSVLPKMKLTPLYCPPCPTRTSRTL